MRVKIQSLNVSTLKEELQSRGLQKSGIKSILVKRLSDYIGCDEIDMEQASNSSNNDMEQGADNNSLQSQVDELKLMMGRLTVMLQNIDTQRAFVQNAPAQNTSEESTSPLTTITGSTEGARPVNQTSAREYSIKEIADMTQPIESLCRSNVLSIESRTSAQFTSLTKKHYYLQCTAN